MMQLRLTRFQHLKKERRNKMDYQNLFNRDFYPTPPEVIEQMVGMSDIAGKIILEPSFGSCNIVKWLNEHHAKEVIGCEINDKLRAAASGVTVIGKDFFGLTSIDVSHIDMIVMNPPFSNQADHILHAWNIAPGGCEIICLCNDSLLQRCGWDRSQKVVQINELIDLYGHSDCLGNVFKEAERSTNVNVSVIRIFKPGTGDNEFDGYFTDEADEPEMQGDGLITYNFVRDIVNRYVAAVSKVDAALAAGNEINELTREFGDFTIQFGAFSTIGTSTQSVTKEQFRKALQKKAWYWIFNKFNVNRFVTTGVMEKLNRFIERQSTIPFTMKNIYRMVDMIVQTRSQIMEEAILEIFDKICKYSDDNVTYVHEKWSTNSAHMINKRFIIPYMGNYDSRWPSSYVEISYGGHERDIEDLIKALDYLTGGIGENVNLRTHMRECKIPWGQWTYWSYFKVKGYKKGTMHFEFQREEDWAIVNQAVAKVRGWELPANVKVKKGGKK